MKAILLSLIDISDNHRQAIEAHYEILQIKNPEEVFALPSSTLERIEALLSTATIALPPVFFEALEQLKVISSVGVGYDPYDEDIIRSRLIRLGYTPDVLNDCVADLSIALMLDCARQISASDRYVRAGRWVSDGPFPLGVQLSHKRLGIVGLGRIGLAIAKRAEAFDMDISYHNRRERDDVPYHYVDTLTALAEQVDFLVVATPGAADTAKLINAEVLKALGPEGYLINIARGVVVDEDALIEALQQRTIAGAALDVFLNEPHVPEALFELDNVTLCPHIGSATRETRQAMRDLAIKNIVHYAEQGEVAVAVPWATYAD